VRHKSELALVGLLAAEIVVFGAAGRSFFSVANAFEVLRLSVELGLLAIALTPIVVSGGIDLGVGSMMGLSAVVLGLLWRDASLPMGVAIALTLAVGAAGGGLTALLVARLGLPPLVVTLGTFSLYRGLAEGLTGGIDNVTGLPPSFLWLGQGYLGGVVPVQLPVLVLTCAAWALVLHRTPFGRSLYAIGLSLEGARHAGIPVARRLGILYVLSGLVASLAAVVYVAHLGQAKADAGTGFELYALTAVVLGGASIAGGRGTIAGTALGLLCIAVLQNGLRMAALPAPMAGILVGVVLVTTLALRVPAREGGAREARSHARRKLVLAAAAGVVLMTLGVLGALARGRTGSTSEGGPARPTVAMMPKAVGDPYFVSARAGAEEAARELGVDLVWDGPTDLDPAKQNEVVEAWITRRVDVIAVSVENVAGISTVLRKARAAGIRVITWDADAEKDARDLFINQATPAGIGYALADRAASLLGERGRIAIVTASLTAANQNEWMKHIRARLAERHPGVDVAVVRPSDGDRDRAFTETQTILKAFPDVRVIVAIAAPAVPGAAEAVKQSGRSDVHVIGLSLPNLCKPYVRTGVVDSIVLWNTIDLGYLTVHAANALGRGELAPGATALEAGRLGTIEVRGDEVLLGEPFTFDRENIERFDF
jgi:rhamnose transport system permease protein